MDKHIDKELLYDAVVCKENDNVLEVSRIMRDTKARHLIVVNDKLRPLGIISPFDVNNRVVAEEKNAKNVKASEIMTKPVETIELKSTYAEAAEKMAILETFTLPVVDKGVLVGVLDYSSVYKKVCEVKKND